MKKSTRWLVIGILFLFSILTACTSDKKNIEENKGDEKNPPIESNGVNNENTLVYTLHSEFEGLFDRLFYESDIDDHVLEFTTEGITKIAENLAYEPNLASWTTEDDLTYIFTFKKGVKWHDGTELTVDDYIFALYTLADKNYSGTRYDYVKNISGVTDYNEGMETEITGIEKLNNYEVKITFDERRVDQIENLWSYPINQSAFEHTPVSRMKDSDAVQTNPVGLGPYKITEIIDGDSITLERHEEYWQGKPRIEKIILKVTSPEEMVKKLEERTVDVAKIHPTIVKQIKDFEDVEVVAYPGTSYFYIGIKHGTHDRENERTTMRTNTVYADKSLKLAMAHAINREEWITSFMEGYGEPINRPVLSSHWMAAENNELPHTFSYDPEKAKQLLEEAGFVDRTGDGFRERPNGRSFEINFSHYKTSDRTFEQRATAIKQYWEAVGLKTKVTMVDSNVYYSHLENDEGDMEVFFGGWSTPANSDPSVLWGSDALWNYSRYVNREADRLLRNARNIDIVGTDRSERADRYVEWQKIMNEEMPALWLYENEEVVAVNKRVKGMTFAANGWNSPHEWSIINKE